MALIINSKKLEGKLVLERITYVAGEGGKRKAEYLGSIHKYMPFGGVDTELLGKLNDEETAKLREYLAPNEPKPLSWLTNLGYSLRNATSLLASVPEQDKASAFEMIAQLDKEWKAFDAEAKRVGVKRTRVVSAEPPKKAEKSKAAPPGAGA